MCNGEKGGKCRLRGVVYQIWCRTCEAEGINSSYFGETGNSCHERGLQHLQELHSQNEETRKKSVLRKHIDSVHEGVETGVTFDMKIVRRFKNDPTGRQVMEGVKMRETVVDNLMNSKDEFCQPGELIPEIPARDFGKNRRVNNNSQTQQSQQSQQTQQSQAAQQKQQPEQQQQQ